MSARSALAWSLALSVTNLVCAAGSGSAPVAAGPVSPLPARPRAEHRSGRAEDQLVPIAVHAFRAAPSAGKVGWRGCQAAPLDGRRPVLASLNRRGRVAGPASGRSVLEGDAS